MKNWYNRASDQLFLLYTKDINGTPIMNYTLGQLQDRITKMIELQGENAPCAAWIYTAEDCMIYDENGDPEYPCDKHPELAERIFYDIGNVDYIYQVIQESVDEVTEEQWMSYQQELV